MADRNTRPPAKNGSLKTNGNKPCHEWMSNEAKRKQKTTIKCREILFWDEKTFKHCSVHFNRMKWIDV